MATIAADAPDREVGENPLVEGLERLPVAPTTMVIFGASGDLAKRKLLPALYNLAHEGALPERFNLIGAARRDQSDDDFREVARGLLRRLGRAARPRPEPHDAAAHAAVHGAAVLVRRRPGARREGQGPR